MQYYKWTKNKDFVSFIKTNKLGFTVMGKLHIYVGGNNTTWTKLLPIFKDVLIAEFQKTTND